MPADLYDVLGVPDDASAQELKAAYRDRVRKYHPDVNDHPEGEAQFKLVKKAHDVLSDPAERKTYDRLGHREYVEQHLDDLPPVSVFPDEDLPEGTSTEDSQSTTGTSGASTTAATNDVTIGGENDTRTTDTGPSGTASSTQSSAGGYGSSGTTSQTSTTESSTGTSTPGSTSTGGAASSSTATGGSTSSSTTDQTSTAGADSSSWDAAASSTQTATSDSTVPEGVRRRRGLKRGWGLVVLSLLVYLGGLGAYLYPRQGALRAFARDVMVTPVPALLGGFPLASPTGYVLGAARAATAGVPRLGLILLAGTVLLPLVVLTTVGRFGRGAAWMYALPSIAPAVCLVAWRFVAVPTWAALVGLIVLPMLSGGGFLVDVGRYLRATR